MSVSGRKVLVMEEKNTTVNNLITIMFAYSAINSRAKVPLLYSVLNPETNSDSPSAKSKGVRLVSARVVVNQHKNRRGNNRIFQVVDDFVMWVMVRDVNTRRGLRIIRDILTSYEIVWATPRSAPSKAYLELENQPAPKVVYTFRLEIHRNSTTLICIKYMG